MNVSNVSKRGRQKIQEIEKQKNIEIELLNNKIAHLNNTKNKKQINSSIIEDNNNFEITNNKILIIF